MNELLILWGADHKVGTSMLAQSCAEIQARTNENVLLLTFSTNPGDDFFKTETHSIEALRSRLSCGLITKDNIRSYTQKGNGIYKLNGLINPRSMYGFTPKMAADLINIATRAFDKVIIDCGTGLDNPLALTALKYSRDIIYIFSQQESSVRRFELLEERISELGLVPKKAVINKFLKGDKYSPSYISQRTGIPQSMFKSVSESEFGIQAEADRNTLLYYGDKQFEKDIKNLIS